MDITSFTEHTLLLGSLVSILLTLKSILYVAFGLGLVIFLHELGHFAVAKWCDVHVEGFSVGFGPAIWSKKWGETVYAIRALPLGGFVKMLGQDDANPAEMTDESIADDPRSYTAKTVPQRMAIISAGVIMNVISGTFFFACAYYFGVSDLPSKIGAVSNGSPAYQQGLRQGDEIQKINGRDVQLFSDIMRSTVFAGKKPLLIEGVHADGSTFKKTIQPKRGERRRQLGVVPESSLQFRPSGNQEDAVVNQHVGKGTASSKATPAFEGEDTIVKVGDVDIKTHYQLKELLARKTSEELVFQVERLSTKTGSAKTTVEVTVPPQPFRTLGLWVEIGQIQSVTKGSVAEKAGLKEGDKIIRVDSTDVGKGISPLRLSDYFSQQHGQSVKITVKREKEGSGDSELELELIPEDVPAWLELPEYAAAAPLSIPSIGAAFQLIPTVLKVEEGSAADGEIVAGEQVQEIRFVLPKGAKSDGYKNENLVFKLNEKTPSWGSAFWIMQGANQRDVELVVADSKGETRVVTLSPQESKDWFLPTRGMKLQILLVTVQADGLLPAFPMGTKRAYHSALEVFMTLKSLISGEVSFRDLRGPLGIASIAYRQAERGIPALLLFMGFISLNLAVINFLPIPVLDGGHMVFLAWEGLTRRKPSERVIIAATLVGIVFVLGLMLTVVYLDIFEHKIFGG